jgi:hypothetical protein
LFFTLDAALKRRCFTVLPDESLVRPGGGSGGTATALLESASGVRFTGFRKKRWVIVFLRLRGWRRVTSGLAPSRRFFLTALPIETVSFPRDEF